MSAKDRYHNAVRNALLKEKCISSDQGGNCPMDRLEQYRKAIQKLLQSYSLDSANSSTFETQVLFDRDHDHYQLVSLGWQGHRRFYSVLMHLDIKDGKIWIQRNETDRLIAQELVEMGIARDHIVLGLQPDYARSDTGYSVA
jgi:hypothetical protein